MTEPACVHEWAGEKGKSASGLVVSVCRRCHARTFAVTTDEFSALSYVDPNRLNDLELDDPERYRTLVERAEAGKARAVAARKRREGTAADIEARRRAQGHNGTN